MGKNKKSAAALAEKKKQAKLFSEQYNALLIAGLLLLALVLRIAALSSFSDSIYSGFLIWDEQMHHTAAQALAEGKKYFAVDVSPLPIYVFALLYKIFGPDPVYVRWLNILIGTATCLVIYYIGREVSDRTAGLLAGVAAALYKPFIFYSITVHKEPLGVFLFASALWLFVMLMRSYSPSRLFLLGAVTGLIMNVRQNAAIVIPVMAVFLLWDMYRKGTKPAGLIKACVFGAAGIALATAPFMLKNYRDSGHLSPAPAGGFNLYFANAPENSSPYFRTLRFVSPVPSEQWIGFTVEAERRTGKSLSSGEASSYWSKEVIRIVLENPRQIASKLFQRTLAVLNEHEEADNYDIGFMSRFVPFFKLPFFSIWFVLPLGLAGMIIHMAGSRKTKGVMAIFAAYAATMVVFFPNMRIRLPLVAILLPYAVIFCFILRDTLKKGLRRKAALYAGLAAAFAIIELMPVEGSGQQAAHYNTHAIVLLSKSRTDDAVYYWKKSSDMKEPYSAYADLSLAGIYGQRRDLKTAREYLARIDDSSFAAAYKYDMLGDLFAMEDKPDEAAKAYRLSLDIQPGQLQPRKKLVDIYRIKDPKKAAEEEKMLTHVAELHALNETGGKIDQR